MHHHYGFDLVVTIFAKNRFHLVVIGAVPPIARDKLHVKPEIDRHLFPQRRELAGLEHQNLVAG